MENREKLWNQMTATSVALVLLTKREGVRERERANLK